MAIIVNLMEHPGFRKHLQQVRQELEGPMPEQTRLEDCEDDDDVMVLGMDEMSDLVEAFKMVQDGLDKIKEITKLDYEEGAFDNG